MIYHIFEFLLYAGVNRLKLHKAHVISHSHWDREWYMPFELHRLKLTDMMDQLIELLERQEGFESFHLDGQTIILDDYLAIRPEQEERLRRLVQAGKLIIGPWYVLQDEFLTSGEANVRNLMIGRRDAERFGAAALIGYFPDSFGNMGQAPQLLVQAGIRTAVFGRGVKPTGANNQVFDGASFESPFSEMWWKSPDGSSVLGILFANWYNNGMEIPTDPEEARLYWKARTAKAEAYASTRHLLFMNGCDHQPVQADLAAALATAREVCPDMEFIHSNFVDYVEAVRAELPDDLATVEGELRSQRTDGWGTLVNTASARVYIKQANQLGQTLLEKVAEPLAAWAARYGAAYPHAKLEYAWRKLMQNHPHDSICGCSIDEVHREMMTRFDQSRQVAQAIAASAARELADQFDTSAFAGHAGAIPFVVFNTSGWERSGTVEIELETDRRDIDYSRVKELTSELKGLPSPEGTVVNDRGEAISASVVDLGFRFNYDLPDARFRIPYYARRLRISLQVSDIPRLGAALFALVPGAGAAAAGTPDPNDSTLENERIHVLVHSDGSWTMTDKLTGRLYPHLGAYEDVGDIGSEYTFRQPEGEAPCTTLGVGASVTCLERSDRRTVVEIVHSWSVPAGADDRLAEESRSLTSIPDRQAQRRSDEAPLEIRTTLTLDAGAQGVAVRTSFDNKATDHRLRVLFPSGTDTDVHRVDSVFEVAVRANSPAPEWTNPSNCQHQQAFVEIGDRRGGLTIANRGLNEYEVLRDPSNTVAITLLRAVSELGDWGVFPTPDAQCLGEHTCEYTVIPHAGGSDRERSFHLAYQSQVPWTAVQTGVHPGPLRSGDSLLRWSSASAALTGVKAGREDNSLVMRWFNMTDAPSELELDCPDKAVWNRSNILEELLAPVEASGSGGATVEVRPYEILTLCLKPELE
ncbi:alpha-mannosidase [Cohnella fermenti]|uniref:Alpha-mannosidase n=1 Tax=Cohnella fermenti TaxID=2565925 RepID=A0A4S4BRP5_9BACL|nr:alpha-mannosidase [Cohnella fermenti]THF77121.1 alpha-mannosidase [Cohnella fermenti]